MSDCGVCLADYEGAFDPADVYKAKTVRARKPHKCIECGDKIPVGAEYERVTANWDGAFDTIHTCLACRDIRVGLSCDGSWMHYALWDDIDEILPELTMACIGKVPSAAGREKLLQRWQEWKGLTR